MTRIAYLSAYAALAALGAALVGRPAILWLRSQGIFEAALAREVPYGALLLACAVALALFTLALAVRAATSRPPGTPIHVAFLLLVGICFALRSASGNPRPPDDPTPALLDAIRIAADELDGGWSGRYTPEAAQFSASLATVPPPPFRRLGRPIPLQVRVLSGTSGPQLDGLVGDAPATIYLAVSADRQTAWITARALEGMLTLPSGQPAVAEAHAGTHALPGGDPALPAYPRTGRPPGG